MIFKKKKRVLLLSSLGLIFLIHFYTVLPNVLFNTPYSKVLLDSNKEILSVKIASDQQWRFPPADSLPHKYKTCLTYFEDEHFSKHWGVNPISLCRAIYQNVTSNKIKSGGSTITMQVIRLSKQNPPRTVWEKVKELYLATRLEFSYSKNEIINLYASHAPFGGNIVGITAASRKYFARPLSELSWSEAATLAVLPNSPSLIFPGKNNHLLKEKRNRLLKKLVKDKVIDKITYSLALEEPLPSRFISFPNDAPHALAHLIKKYPNQNRFHSTLIGSLQRKTDAVLNHHVNQYTQNHINNGALLVIDNYTNQVVSYIGNSAPINHVFHENYVDIVQSARSTGSILKPFLHAAALDDGLILNQSLLADIPTLIQGFAPQNYSKTYEGAVKANTALARSLNIPAVRLLKDYGYPRFHNKLQQLTMSTLTYPADHYGLSLILGGAETTLWDLGKMYSGMAKTLNHFENAPLNRSYSNAFYDPPTLLHRKQTDFKYSKSSIYKASSIFETFETLLELKRPTDEGQWRLFNSSKKIAWKTGTSYGLRDAWAVGVTPQYTVAIWIGNATGEGRPELVGVLKAAPVLFSAFNLLPNSNWFHTPKREMYDETICRFSGRKASSNCYKLDTILIGSSGKKSSRCSYCKTIFINSDNKRVNSTCYPVAKMKEVKLFSLPPIQEWYYIQKSANYTPLPSYDKKCSEHENISVMNFIYPNSNAKVYIPRELQGNRGTLVCEATHRNSNEILYWHLDEQYLGHTQGDHQMPIEYNKGRHLLSILDGKGREKHINFKIL